MGDAMSDDGVDRVYTIVVHGTRLGRSKGDWWKRISLLDTPFCNNLSRKLQEYGVPFAVWQNCEDFGMDEFEWSGDNDHHARLNAGKDLAHYLNKIQDHVKQSCGCRPVFNLLGHSHGGNVILASLAHLKEPIDILGIHFLGTPFMLYDNPSKWLKAWARWLYPLSNFFHRLGPYNIYLTGDPRCEFMYVWQAFNVDRRRPSGASDEVQLTFSYMRTRQYFKHEINRFLRSLIERPRWRRIERIPVRHFILGLTVDGSYAERARFGFASMNPSLRITVLGYLKQIWAFLIWPIKCFFVFLAAPLLAGWMARRIFAATTGLDPAWFSPRKLTISEGLGFNHPYVIYSDLEVSEVPKIDIRVGQWLGASILDSDRIASEAISSLAERIKAISGQMDLFHSSYYQSDRMIEEIAEKTARELVLRGYPHLVDEAKLANKSRGTSVYFVGTPKGTRRFSPGSSTQNKSPSMSKDDSQDAHA
jgi:hypothetical protein